MDYMKLVADLCQIIDRQNEITKAMAVQLGQRDALRYEEERRRFGGTTIPPWGRWIRAKTN